MTDTGQPDEVMPAPRPIGPPDARPRYPIIYISYQLWVEHSVLFPQGTPRYARHSEDPRTPENWKYHHECITSDDTEVVPFGPCEVPFERMSIRDFKRAMIDLVGATRGDFDLTRVLRAADAGRKLQWRGTSRWPDGPILRNIDVARNFPAYARMASNAVLPKKVHLRLYMEDPIMRPRYPRYWTWIPNRGPNDVWVPFQPNGAPPPPPEDCIVLGGVPPPDEASLALATIERAPPSTSSWIIEPPSSTVASEVAANVVRSPSYHSSSARSSPGWVPPGSEPGSTDGSSSEGQCSIAASVTGNPDQENEGTANGGATTLVSSPGLWILDGPPSSWQERDYTYIRSSSPPEVEVLSTPQRPIRAPRRNNN
ncbi:hypothetical protein PGT21_016865 [Puccinia graminis f. sp. tritici]|uniref:Uncharacterized protein n=2 Tax=Puccinia graminis f. sp. tritici TaxID=56615 RepID=E3KL12_PUCGT|nr:uncharacterized protein PGTG_11156 [Puccinia graminis f. sp. tritici CRL 75-36-700-3]EFP84987.1 hypothetical protein PGTG_11156 [Puccinia graminis f. sp. tritici CRL 75-36-700-3]KAA1084751.1 hypothetical protein PGT21_035069 [Puccinia graminis f. sp. tritici]KAA1094398.1 hypothetical protein PGT21_020193 [Puccinia graminis f. sp. tritici]KAA1096439.1 hypothetical protein PGT21_016865 [Puccinia graminis f. sp. tritici]